MFRHPKYYKELRKLRNKLDQAISDSPESRVRDSVRPDPGLKQQAASDSQVVNQVKLSSQSQASSSKRQAATGPGAKLQASSLKHQATSIKP